MSPSMSTPELTPTATMCSMTAGAELAKDVEKVDINANAEAGAETTTAQSLSSLRKTILLCILCSAQFFDIFNAVSVIIALPDVGSP